MYHILFIHLSVNILGCFHCLAIVNNCAVVLSVQISVRIPVFNQFVQIPMSGIAGPYKNTIMNRLNS